MKNDHEQPDELQQQPTLPLLYLPIELAEEVSMYFEGRAAAKLLTVSRSFHSLFLPRVWSQLSTFIDIKGDEVKRQMLLEKYGHFVRIIDLTDDTTSEFIFDWLPFVKCATHLKACINRETTAEMAETLMKLIKQSKMLRTLYLRFDEYGTPVKFDELAAAINELEYLESITCEFDHGVFRRDPESGWKRPGGFIDLFHPSKRSKLRLKMDFNTYFDEVEVRAMAPYIDELVVDRDVICTIYLADVLFDTKGEDGQPLVFPQLKELSMTSCCFNRGYYSAKSIIASRFPQLQRLYFDIGSCSFLDRYELNYDEHETYNWKAEYSGYAHIIVPSQRWQCLTSLRIGIVSSSILMDIIDLNPQLEYIYIDLEYMDAPVENDASKYNHDEFQLDAILDRLPHLVDFSIGRLNSRVVADSAAIPLKRRYNLRIGIGCQMSIAPSAAVYILQMSRLTSLSFIDCVFADIYETIQMLQNKTVACGVKGFQWYPIVWNQDLALVVTEKMPQLEYFLVDRCPKKYRNAFKVKCRLAD